MHPRTRLLHLPEYPNHLLLAPFCASFSVVQQVTRMVPMKPLSLEQEGCQHSGCPYILAPMVSGEAKLVYQHAVLIRWRVAFRCLMRTRESEQ